MIPLRAFYTGLFLTSAVTVLLCLALYMAFLKSGVRVDTITLCFGPNVDISGHGPPTDFDLQIIKECQYGTIGFDTPRP